ncbi:MAG: hypothetical protein JXA46_07795 [Dehalococcoidales bacterium]|nr:hypothetical protein [Dehalococcoidales bacterium]
MRSNKIEETIDLLSRLPRVMRKSTESVIFKPLLQSIDRELSPHHMVIMKIVEEEGVISISKISDAALIARAQMTHSIDRLISLGMLDCVPDRYDRRKKVVIITQKGKQAVASFDSALKSHMSEKLSWLDDRELDKLLDSLTFLLKTMGKF